MSVLKQVTEKIAKFKPGKVFAYSDFSLPQESFMGLAKSLSVLSKKGIISRVAKGMYYKPEYFVFGTSLPTDEQIIDTVLHKNKAKVAYITGATAYNQLGLTTQVSKYIVVATDSLKGNTKIQNTEIKFVKSRVTENFQKTRDIPLLQMLDAITDCRSLLDIDSNLLCKVISIRLQSLSDQQKYKLREFVSLYPPATRALIGALLEQLGDFALSKYIKNTLNAFTQFKFGISAHTLPNKNNWKIQ